MLQQTYPFVLPPPPLSFNSLFPCIDNATMVLHYCRHFKGYVDSLNEVLSNTPEYQSLSLEMMLENLLMFPPEIRNQIRNYAGGVYNHYLYFSLLSPPDIENSLALPEALSYAFSSAFGSEKSFFETFKHAAISIFGSGWAWLLLDKSGGLRIATTSNQDSVLGFEVIPLLLCDVWEHAYYLKYKNKRAEYVDAFFRVVNWNNVCKRLNRFSGNR